MRTLFVRLSTSHLMVALGSLGLLLFIAPRLFLHFYLLAEQQRLTAAARGLSRAAVRLAARPPGSGELEILVRTSAAVLGGEVALLSPDGRRVVVASHPRIEGARWALQAHREHHSGVEAEISFVRGRAATLVLVAPSEQPASHIGVVVIRRPAAELQTMIRAQRLMTAASATLAAILALILSLVLSRAIASPLVSMSRAAQQLAAEDFSVIVPEQGPTELASLATSLNSMAQSLATAFSAVASERQRLAEVLATMAEGVISLDRQGRIALANRAAGELLGQDLISGAPLEAGATSDWGRQALSALHSGAARFFVVAREQRFLSFSLSPAQEGGAVLVIADITASRRLETMRREFVAAASHELRAPLTSIRGFLGAVLDGTADTREEREHCLRVAAREASRMSRLVDELLELSRLQAGAMQFEFQPTDLAQVIAAVGQAFEPRLQAKQVSLRVQVDPALPETEADGDRLAQVLVNLLDNALRFSPPGSTIEVRAALARPGETLPTEAPILGGAMLCTVRDRGPGIPEADLTRIWERFHKSDQSRTPSDAGAGLGLAIVREIVRTHGGDVFARNRRQGGAAIGFWLPLTPPDGVSVSEGRESAIGNPHD